MKQMMELNQGEEVYIFKALSSPFNAQLFHLETTKPKRIIETWQLVQAVNWVISGQYIVTIYLYEEWYIAKDVIFIDGKYFPLIK